jgi:UDP-N-acetyl-D-galactosamine dehydrogenase
VDVHDPWADPADALAEYGLQLVAQPVPGTYDAVILAVAHDKFRLMGAEAIRALVKPAGVIFDVKHLLPREAVDGRL